MSNAREARLQYHKDNELMYNLVKEMQHKGATIEEIARVANQRRNLNRLQSYIDTGNMVGYEKAVESNIRNFQNELGMTAEQAYNRYGSWYIVLEKAVLMRVWMLVADCMMISIIYIHWEVNNMIKISIKQYDEKNDIVIITKEDKNIWGTMSMMQFEDDMDYFGISVRLEGINGNKGYVFSKNINKDLIYYETRRFIENHKLESIN